jgi:hypothetical protein
LLAVFDVHGNLVGVAAGDFSLDSELLQPFTLREVDAELSSRIDLEECSNVVVSECRLEVSIDTTCDVLEFAFGY